MSHNLRKGSFDDELYVNVKDLFKLMVDVMTMDGIHPEAAKALDGLGIGLAIALGVVSPENLPGGITTILDERLDHD
jgi:hypothetical protein